MTVLIIVLGIIGAATNSARTTMQRSTTEVGAYSVARSAFEDMSQKLSQATLNTYWDYYDASGKSRGAYAAYDAANNKSTTATFVPATYGRASDLHFFVRQNTQDYRWGQEVFFQTPVAYSQKTIGGNIYPYQDTQGLMNACCYYIEYGPDSSYRPATAGPTTNTTSSRWRFRLIQGLEPTEKFSVFSNVAQVQAGQGTLLAGVPYPTQKAPVSASPWTWTWVSLIYNQDYHGNIGAGAGHLWQYDTPVADNVIALIAWPRLPLREDPIGSTITGLNSGSPDFSYDSQQGINQRPSLAQPQYASDEQLPPIVQLTAVVIDEASAARLAASATAGTVPAAITTAFSNAKLASGTTASSLFQISTQAQYNADLTALGTQLAKAKINYQVFNTYVVMRESKWSQ